MFRLHRSKGTKPGQMIDVRLSNFQANQVPKGWDKLFVSIISVETGKTLAKSSKALVRNGSCVWRETLTESVWVGEGHSSKELEDCSLRFVVAMGSSRSSILGEATVNVTGYIDSITPVPLSLPLKKCSHGTALQVNLHCSAQKNKFREEGQDDVSSHSVDLNADFDAKSDASQGSFARSFGSSSGKDPDSSSKQGETPSRGTSFSDSRRSSISADGSTGRGTSSPRNILSSDKYSSVTRHDATGLPSTTPKFVEDSPRSNYSSLSSKGTIVESGQIALLKNVGSPNRLLEAAENTIDEIREETKMWERNARKLMVDLDVLKKEYSDQSSIKANLELELSAARSESDGLKKEIRQLEQSLEDLKIKQNASEYSTSRSHIEKRLEDEIKFNRESNSELALQLQKAQESNIELVSILQELEETIETQKAEIKELSDLNSKFSSTNHIHEGLEESKTIITEQSLEESEKMLLEKVKSLEQDLKEKTSELENERSLRSQLQLSVSENNRKLSDKDDKISNLEVKLSVFIEKGCADEPIPVGDGSMFLNIELEALREKVQELERDCTELTDENLELLFKLKQYQNCSGKEVNLYEFPRQASSKSCISSGYGEGETEGLNSESEMDKRLHKVDELELLDVSKTCSEIFKQLQMAFSLVNTPLQDVQKCDNERNDNVTDNQVDFEDETSCKEKADLILRRVNFFNKALEALIFNWSSVAEVREDEIRMKDFQKLESYEADSRGTTASSKCVNDLRNELLAVKSSLDSHVSTNKILEKKMMELEIRKQDQELHITELKKENVQLSERVHGLETQLRCLTTEKESTCMELETSKVLVSSLQNQLSNADIEKEKKLLDQNKKMEEMQKRLLEQQEEIENLNASNSKLKTTAENIMEESSMKLQSLMIEIDALKQENETMKADLEKMTKLVEKCRSSEERLMTSFNNLELKLSVSECERQQILEEAEGLKIQSENLKNEITSLKSVLNSANLEKDRLQSSLQLMTDDCETQKAEKVVLTAKIHALEKAVSTYEDCKRIKDSLEEKILHLEGDMIAKEATCAQDIELKNELGRIKSESRQQLRKIENLEEENNQLLKKYQEVNEELKLLNEAKHVQNLKNDSVASTNQRRMGRRKSSLITSQEHLRREQTANGNQYQVQAENAVKFHEEVGTDSLLRIQTLENDLADALEANHLYKLQLKRLTEGNSHTISRSKSSLEVELRDIKERYLHMSLKYAEVEAQREELVMKLKAARTGKRWF